MGHNRKSATVLRKLSKTFLQWLWPVSAALFPPVFLLTMFIRLFPCICAHAIMPIEAIPDEMYGSFQIAYLLSAMPAGAQSRHADCRWFRRIYAYARHESVLYACGRIWYADKLSSNYLSIFLRKHANMTFNDPLIHKCSADKSIQTIVEQTGYRDCTHFVKSFKRVVGVTPMQYSNSKKGSEK